ncbi:hypothetical protein [Amphritea japonica]|uniref:hypothetical protein n=1 Tax=Amphritea japonica TaxID=452627 RepID=UPI00058FA12D|nr:hypothetical protein [Amphritea japonica]
MGFHPVAQSPLNGCHNPVHNPYRQHAFLKAAAALIGVQRFDDLNADNPDLGRHVQFEAGPAEGQVEEAADPGFHWYGVCAPPALGVLLFDHP